MKKILITAFMVLFLCAGFTGTAPADDTEIYGTVTVSVPPNVMIMFDNSGSMSTQDVPGEYYNPATTYDGPYVSTRVYQSSRYGWSLFANSINDLNCDWIKQALASDGYVRGAIRSSNSNYTCGGWTTRNLRTGNFMNYDISGVGADRSRISVAKEVITQLLDQTENVRFGLFIFNNDDGGHLVSPCGTDKATLISRVNALSAQTWTPLGETLAEVGLYYAGKQSWFNSGTYTSPMTERCQKNYVVIMTDGEPTQDVDWRLTSASYINGDTIGDYDNDGNDPGYYASSGSDYLDDVAKYLYVNDCNPTLGTGTSYEQQRIITYTIGFKIDNDLLNETAMNGGGEYYTANSISGLSEAFEAILSNITEANAVFVAPVVPVSRMNRTFSGDYIYLGFFRPQQSGRWVGNLKKYGLDDNGNPVDVYGIVAILPDGTLKDNSTSYWSGAVDGPNVTSGGAGGVLLDQATRNIYTYMGTQALLTHEDNDFSADNAIITAATIGVETSAQRQSLIQSIYGGDRYWYLGDILHSEPEIVHYDASNTYIFVGSNDGMLHCFNDASGTELWAFIPDDQLGRLPLLLNDDHDYFVDGSPVLYTVSGQKVLIFGERRGGEYYSALDVTSIASPRWLYRISPGILGGETLGQSWCQPVPGIMKTAGGTESVFLIAGGYDTNQDQASPGTDSVGRAVYAVNAASGTLSFNINASNYAAMTYCILDVSGFDTDSDDIMDTIYAGDLGGNMFAFEDRDSNGSWTKRKLFMTPGKKIFYAPDAVKEEFGEIVFFGTGDRADPSETSVVNRIYAVKNDWEEAGGFSTITEADLVDVTDNLVQMGTEEQKTQVREALENAKGWYIRLTHSGEKVVSTPTVFAGTVYFTTYTPEGGGGADPDDPCAASAARGLARLYAVDYLTGGAVHDFSDTTETDAGGDTVERGTEDRSKEIGTGIPSQPVIAIREQGPKLYIGKEGGVSPEDPAASTDINVFYWRQLF